MLYITNIGFYNTNKDLDITTKITKNIKRYKIII
jgi:uncharacterized protein YkvS